MDRIYRTAGEQLYRHLAGGTLADSEPWVQLEQHLAVTNRGPELVEFFRELAGATLMCRIVAVGRSLQEDHGPTGPAFTLQFGTYLRETLHETATRAEVTFRIAQRAVGASDGKFSKAVKKKALAEARRRKPECYMCGVRCDFSDDNSIVHATCDHVWPSSYGGDNEIENLLIACSSCNQEKKKNTTIWAMVGIQSVILGLSPGDALDKIEGTVRFALHHRMALRMASQIPLSLKDSYTRLGPWGAIRVRNPGSSADFFNLENHTTGSVPKDLAVRVPD